MNNTRKNIKEAIDLLLQIDAKGKNNVNFSYSPEHLFFMIQGLSDDEKEYGRNIMLNRPAAEVNEKLEIIIKNLRTICSNNETYDVHVQRLHAA